jgi:hypothetical protein
MPDECLPGKCGWSHGTKYLRQTYIEAKYLKRPLNKYIELDIVA